MHRSRFRNALVLVSALALGCQSYNFNPINQCVIQPGSERVSLSSVSSADVLFVVDDSGSMFGEQDKLEDAFDAFIESLNGYNDRRVGSGLEPFDFHIAITTTSVFHNRWTPATCQASCGGKSNVCCNAGTPVEIAKTCPAGTGCGSGYTCRTDCQGRPDEKVCCDSSRTPEKTTLACTTQDAPCGAIQNRYVFDRTTKTCTSDGGCTNPPYDRCAKPVSGEPGCGGYGGNACCATTTTCAQGFAIGTCAGLTGVCCFQGSPSYPQGTPEFVLNCAPGVAVEGDLYPRGDFVGVGTNPRVLHYDKKLYGTRRSDGTWDAVGISTTTTGNEQGFTRPQLKSFFKANVNVGTCGSGQEQGFEAARLAIAKAFAGRQFDTRNAHGDLANVPADWPQPGSKLVVVYVGDEDDCSAEEDPVNGVILSGVAGADTCVADAALPLEQQKEFKVADVVHDLQSLGRPIGVGFVISTNQTSCVDAGCTASPDLPGAGKCCDYQCTTSGAICGSSTCGGQAAGERFVQAAGLLRGAGADVVTASICEPGTPKACSGAGDCSAFAGSTCYSGCGGLTGSFCCYRDATTNPIGTPAGTDGFGPTLSRIAEIVKPPSALELPTQPANAEITLLRITSSDGITRKFCNGPALPPAVGSYITDPDALTSRAIAFDAAVAAGYDWWFTETRDQIDAADKAPWTASSFVYINHETANCEPNPGEVYSADYLGMLPPGGCTSDATCETDLGGKTPWTCFAGREDDGTCTGHIAATGTLVPGLVGSCVCGEPAVVCPPPPP